MKTVFELGSLGGLQESFAQNGFVRICNVFSLAEVEIIRREVEQVKQIARTLPEGLVWFSPSFKEGFVIQRITRINQYSSALDEIGHSHSAITQISTCLLGVNKVRCADGSEGSDGGVLVIKDPNNASEHRELRWHRDAKFTQHLPINPFVNLGIYLDNSGLNMGGLVILPGSHRPGVFNESFEETTQYHPGEVCVEAKVGDVVVHSSEVWHCSRNYEHLEGQRRVLYFNYYPANEVEND